MKESKNKVHVFLCLLLEIVFGQKMDKLIVEHQKIHDELFMTFKLLKTERSSYQILKSVEKNGVTLEKVIVTTNFLGENPSYDSEKITTTIQKIKQDQSSTKPKWEGEVVEGILYKGKDLEDLNNPIFNGAIYPGTSESAL